MKLKKETIAELGQILKIEFNIQLEKNNLEKLAHALIGYFDLLYKIQLREGVRK